MTLFFGWQYVALGGKLHSQLERWKLFELTEKSIRYWAVESETNEINNEKQRSDTRW